MAASRTFWTAGNSRPISTAMMAMTTSNSIRVKPRTRPRSRRNMTGPPRSVGTGRDLFGELEVVGPVGRLFDDLDGQPRRGDARVLGVGEPAGLPGQVADVHRLAGHDGHLVPAGRGAFFLVGEQL